VDEGTHTEGEAGADARKGEEAEREHLAVLGAAGDGPGVRGDAGRRGRRRGMEGVGSA
jgi:hypothetical protein